MIVLVQSQAIRRPGKLVSMIALDWWPDCTGRFCKISFSQKHVNAPIEIVDFEPGLAGHFLSLNMEWLQRYFAVEPIDQVILGDPHRYIIRKGGAILFAKNGATIVGTCALKPEADIPGNFELTKMAVAPEYRGRGVGRALLVNALARFRALKGQMLFLETNSRLTPAIRLYEKMGFERKPPPHPSAYSRADVYMVYRHSAVAHCHD